jgi:hypothetical protein
MRDMWRWILDALAGIIGRQTANLPERLFR